MSSGLRRFDLRLDDAERAALRSTARAKGVSATMLARQLIRAGCGLPSLLGDPAVIGEGITDECREDAAPANGHGERRE